MSVIVRLPWPGIREPVDPYPVLPAVLSSTGRTILYPCPFCGLSHRLPATRLEFRYEARVTRRQPCRNWARLFPPERRERGAVVELEVVHWAGHTRAVAELFGFYDGEAA